MYGYARVSVREPEDKNLDLQVERLVRAGCSMGNVRAEEASGAKDARGGLLELLDLVVEGDTLVVTHIDRLSRGLTYGLQVIEGLHLGGVEFRSLSEDFDTSTATGKLQLQMVLAFSVAQLDQGPLGRRPGEGAGRGAFPRPEAEPDRAAKGLHPGGAVEGSEPAGTGQAPGGQPLDHPAGGQVGVGWAMQPLHGACTTMRAGPSSDREEDHRSVLAAIGQLRSRKGFPSIEEAKDFVESFRPWELFGTQGVTVDPGVRPALDSATTV